MTEFTRKELQQIVSKAKRLSSEEMNLLWKRIYERLADVAWALDACIARTEDK